MKFLTHRGKKLEESLDSSSEENIQEHKTLDFLEYENELFNSRVK